MQYVQNYEDENENTEPKGCPSYYECPSNANSVILICEPLECF